MQTQLIKPFKYHTSNMRKTKRIHFIGIGGAGMGGIAEVLLTEGYEITGSDVTQSIMTERLARLGAKISFKHTAENINNVDVVVISSAIKEDNPERLAALAHNIPLVPRAQMLAELMRFRHGIAVAGTHGKTTTTSLLTSLLAKAQLDPTFVIGGLLNSAGANAQLGESRYFVAEADESDGSFMYLNPMVSIVTNIDSDHLSTYQGNFANLKQTFIDFIHKLPFYGLAVVCLDCPVVRSVLQQLQRPVITYGFSDGVDLKIENFKQVQNQSYFVVKRKNADDIEVHLNLPGRHNALNATAAIAVALEEGVDIQAITEALKEFKGIGRRFAMTPNLTIGDKKVMFVDDYGHHPAEVKATIQAIRDGWPDKRLVMAFQPHRYSRTRDYFDDFVDVLSTVDELLLLEVYSAGESKIPEADGQSLCRAIEQKFGKKPIYIKEVGDLSSKFSMVLQNDDILITQGAGNIGLVARDLVTVS